MQINIGKDFARYPAGRYRLDGPNSGERFREELLVPALMGTDLVVEIVLSEAVGLKSSFLEEAFGGLVRAGFGGHELLRRLRFISNDASLPEEILQYIQKQMHAETDET